MAPINSSDYNSPEQYSNNAPSSRRSILIISSLLGILIIFLGFWQLKNKVNKPFQLEFEETTNGLALADPTDSSVDTDGDGLTDYEEIFIYNTSAYLEDTDSDGLIDKEEVEKGSDPNCPVGGNCFSLIDFEAQANASQVVSSTIDNTTVLVPSQSEDFISGGANDDMSEDDLRRALAGEIEASALRELLIAGGADKAVLDQISDEELLASYRDVLNNQNEE